MSALSTTHGARSGKLARSTFQIWRKVEGRTCCDPFSINAASIADVEAYLSDSAWYKMLFIVLEIDVVTERMTQHVYTVRKGAWQGRFNDQGMKQYPYRAECLVSFEVISFQPALRWRWTPDADVIGGDGVINVSAGENA